MKKTIILSAIAIIAASCADKNPYDAQGYFESTEITVSSEAAGRIIDLNIEEGQIVEKDQIVGHIDSLQLYYSKVQLEQSNRAVLGNRPDTRKQIAALREQLSKAETEKNRLERLFKDNAATQKQLDDINSQIKVIEKQIDAQKSALDNTLSSLNAQGRAIEAQIGQIEDKLSKCTITSPAKGTVLSKYAEEGELATIGKPLFKIADLDNIRLRAYLTSEQLSDIKIGDKVQVFADFGKGNTKEYTGAVSWISDKSEFTPKSIQTENERANLVYAVKIDMKNDGFVKLGMFGGIKL